MIFKDRQDAGEKLSEELLKDKNLLKGRNNLVVVSLLRGGVVVGKIIAKRLDIEHIPLAVTKIPAPYNPELAIGSLCFDIIFLQKDIINNLSLQKEDIDKQISLARIKHSVYIQKYDLQKINYAKLLRNKIVIIVDDGVATGATAKAALLFAKSKKAKKVILAVPVAPTDFDIKGFDSVVSLHKDPFFSSVSQFYGSFPQGEEVI